MATLLAVLPKMLVSFGIFDMVDEMCLVFPGICSRCSQKMQVFLRDFGHGGWNLARIAWPFPGIFDVWAEFGEFPFLKSARFLRHS